jgi:PAS domain S-box-containing protein
MRKKSKSITSKTKRKHSHRLPLRSQGERLRLLPSLAADLIQKTFDSVRDAIFILDARVPPTIHACNQAACAIFGYQKSEMLGKTTAFLHVDDEAIKQFESLLYPVPEKGRPFYLPEFRMKRKDGSI